MHQTPNTKHKKDPRFLVDSTLGRLAKWLRLAGFDTLYDTRTPNPDLLARICRQENRTLLTRIRMIGPVDVADMVCITFNAPEDQIRQVINELGLGPEALKPLTRCARCNCLVQEPSKAVLFSRVPEYILQNHTVFRECPQCDRIFWQGSHAKRWLAFMDGWFAS